MGSGVTTEMVQAGSSFTGDTFLVIELLLTRLRAQLGIITGTLMALFLLLHGSAGEEDGGTIKDGDMHPRANM